MPLVGPLSRMCGQCRVRLCRKDAAGQFIWMTKEEVEQKYPKGFYHP
jgi:hypothetical protein